jgi:prophage antirepressor-like protein
MADSNLVPFGFDGQSVRVIMRDGEPWFVRNDVCTLLEYADFGQAVEPLDTDERAVISLRREGVNNTGPHRNDQIAIISESGLYALILRSTQPRAKAFRRWVTSEVLPQIRKTGRYAPVQAPRLPFTDWIMSRRVTDTPRGDFIADTKPLIERGRFPEPESWDDLETFLEFRGACDMAILMARRCWVAWQKQGALAAPQAAARLH